MHLPMYRIRRRRIPDAFGSRSRPASEIYLYAEKRWKNVCETHLDLGDIAEHDEDVMKQLLPDIVCEPSHVDCVLLVGHSSTF